MTESLCGQARAHGRLLIIAAVVALLAIAGCSGQQPIDEKQLLGSPAPSDAAATLIPTGTSNPPATVQQTPTVHTNTPVPPPTSTATAEPSSGVVVATPLPALSPAPVQTAAPAGPPVRIVFPDLKIDAEVVEMSWQVTQTSEGPQSEWIIPENAAGHHINSAMLGEAGNIVLSAHNNIYGKVFGPISWAWDNDGVQQVNAATDQSGVLDGRIIQLFAADGREFDFAVTAFYRLRDTGVSLSQRVDNARFMQPTSAGQLTLITCWPPNSNTHRLVVVAQPVSR